MEKIQYEELLKSQAPEYDLEKIRRDVHLGKTIVVLDDDPTGCQTLYNIPVLFTWKKDVLEDLFMNRTALFFILINTRSMPESNAIERIGDVMENLLQAKESTGRDFIVISRSDSTLRGHYPAEVDAIDAALSGDRSMHCLVPAFFPGGRFTCNNIHYVKEGDYLFPASATPFATDKIFGFRNASLPGYIEEKTEGRIKKEEVLCFSVEELRKEGPAYVSNSLLGSDHPACIVNALAQSDLDVFAVGAREALINGKKILFRTGASFLNSFGNIPPKAPLESSCLSSGEKTGGLIVVGSYVPKTSAQIMPFLESESILPLEFRVQQYIEGENDEMISSMAIRCSQIIAGGGHVLIYTSRKLFQVEDAEKNLEIGRKVSNALVEMVRQISVQPSFLIAKGGVTAHEIGSRGLEIGKATVIGQAMPGVPVLVPEDRDELKYIIFPGNVGDDHALMNLFRKLTG